jgi:two-component system cell cycle sensor histidine kinase/response regulator CckA
MAETPPFRLEEILPRALIEAVPSGVVVVREDGGIVSANAEALRFLGLHHDQITRRYIASFQTVSVREDGTPMPPEEYPVSRALATGEPQGPEVVGVQRSDGVTSWGVFRGTPVKDELGRTRGAYVTFVDITARRESEEKLRNSEHRWRSLAASVDDFVIVVDRDLKVRWINRVLPHLDPDEIEGRSSFDFMPAGSRDILRDNLRHVFEHGEVRGFEIHGEGPEGRMSTYETRAAPLREGDEITGAVIVSRDVTENLAMRAQIARSERLASLGLIAAGIAHEINNPLTYIKTNLAYVARQADPHDKEVVEALADAQAGVDRVSRIIRDLQVFSTAADDPREIVDPVATVDSVLALVRNEIRHRARIVRDYGSVPAVEASPARLGQAFLNLLVNAAHAIDVGDAENNEIRIAVRARDRDVVEITVSDTGRGIDAADLDHVFEPFFTTKPFGSGVGLGLSICHDYVTRLGGTIDVRSEPGKGTTFVVRLPAARTSRPVPAAQAVSLPPERLGLRILVVDDDRAVAGALARMLSGHHVDLAYDADSALARLDEQRYDAIVCDVMMPDQSGPQLHTRVRARDPLLAERFVFITGGAFSDPMREALQGLGNPVLDKPVEEPELNAAIAAITRPRP